MRILAAVLVSLVACACGSTDDDESEPEGVRCNSSTGNETVVWCSEVWTDCEDNRKYEVECQGSSGVWICNCRIDGQATLTANSADFCDTPHPDRTPLSNPLCGWSIR